MLLNHILTLNSSHVYSVTPTLSHYFRSPAGESGPIESAVLPQPVPQRVQRYVFYVIVLYVCCVHKCLFHRYDMMTHVMIFTHFKIVLSVALYFFLVDLVGRES